MKKIFKIPKVFQLDIMMNDIIELSKGNPGAIRVLTNVYSLDPMKFYDVANRIREMDFTGSKIWCAYNDYCGKDIELFSSLIMSKDGEMIDQVNSYMDRGAAPPCEFSMPRLHAHLFKHKIFYIIYYQKSYYRAIDFAVQTL